MRPHGMEGHPNHTHPSSIHKCVATTPWTRQAVCAAETESSIRPPRVKSKCHRRSLNSVDKVIGKQWCTAQAAPRNANVPRIGISIIEGSPSKNNFYTIVREEIHLFRAGGLCLGRVGLLDLLPLTRIYVSL